MAVQSALLETVDIQRQRAANTLRPWLRKEVASLKTIFDKKKYQRFVTAEWTPQLSKKLRRTVANDATWKAFKDQKDVFTMLYRGELRNALVQGALAAHAEAERQTEEAAGVELDWTLSRSDLSTIGASDVRGYSKEEIANKSWDDLVRALDGALRTAALKQRNMSAVRTEFNRRADSAIDRTLSGLDTAVGDAVTDGYRFIFNQFEHTRVRVA